MSTRIPAFIAAAILALVIAPLATFAADDDNWQPLFDGQSLSGFHQLNGKAKYLAVDGVVLGVSIRGQPNSFLCTDKDYGDFILEYDFRVDPKLNSGVQIRSESVPEYNNGRVHGYQVEIDPDVKRGRLWTAGIYDESRRGWLAPMDHNEAAQQAFKDQQWNHIRVEAIGDSIKTWLNDVPAADLVDSMTPSGFIALQVHGVGGTDEGPFCIAWRNLRIQDLGRHVWKPLFDGKTLTGWSPTPGGEWKVENGMIVGTKQASDNRHSILLSEKTYGDFTARIVYKSVTGNSGLYFHVEQVDGTASVKGFQAEIDPEKDAGGLYETGGRGWVVQPDPELVKKAFKPGEWNQMTVSSHGGRIVTHVNNIKTAEVFDDPGRTTGMLGIQLHGGQDCRIEVKSIDMLVKDE